MPVKRRVEKRRMDPAAELAVWSVVFDSGHDFFGELPAINVGTDDYGRPNRDAAEAAWRRLGAIYLADRNPNDPSPWALAQFGEPSCR